ASKKFIGLAGEAAEGIILPAGRLLVADRLDKDSKYRSVLLKYKETYEKRYDSSVSTFGGHAYDAFMMFKYGIEKGGKEADKMISAIESRGPFIGTAGEFNITATDHNGLDKSAFVMLKIHNGDWELIN
ncbi:MAG TPA: ABC transporter substrate-binding protein, partial [Flexistipes sinusarabici]|nr:ABC transporter substrate-binding protein [Flexistipes sinusarabici]